MLQTLGDVEEKEHDDDDAAPTTLSISSPCVAGEFWSALEMLFETLKETHHRHYQVLSQFLGSIMYHTSIKICYYRPVVYSMGMYFDL